MKPGFFYITTTLPYVNAEPHVGYATEIMRADVLARAHRLLGEEVFFNTGTDEHGQKIYQKAMDEGRQPQEYVDEYAAKFDRLRVGLNLSYNNFIRTTDEHHIRAAQEFWKRCEKNGDIYKAKYRVKYCVGCELEKTDSDLVDGKCPLHPGKALELIDEENYFFRFSKYQDRLLELYKERPEFVIPEFRRKEMEEFVRAGLKDFSVSRIAAKMPWGIPVPGDETHVLYVWFDALGNYITALNWPEDEEKFSNFWPGIQVCGKDNLRQQTAMWQAMLMSAGLPGSEQVMVGGFLTVNGQKISKSLGNTINPLELTEKYGIDPVRYYFLGKIDPFTDSDFSFERFEEVYTSDLANGLGNLVSRVSAMIEISDLPAGRQGLRFKILEKREVSKEVTIHLDKFEFDKAVEWIWERIRECDGIINEKQVWKLEGGEKKVVLVDLVERIRQIAFDLQPFLPETAEKILKQYSGEKIQKETGLFPRLTT